MSHVCCSNSSLKRHPATVTLERRAPGVTVYPSPLPSFQLVIFAPSACEPLQDDEKAGTVPMFGCVLDFISAI